MTIQEMKEKKKEAGFSNKQLAELSGVPLGTLQKIFSGETESPRYETIRALEGVLNSVGSGAESDLSRDSRLVRETSSSYGALHAEEPVKKQQGTYTLADYYALPEDQRVELIDGVFYDMTAPSTFHQILAGEAYRQISNYIQTHKGRCIPFISPVDVQLDCDDKTMVEPDVAIVCDKGKIIRRCIMGAPDFVLEVISPGTRRKDYTTKMMKYMNAGVREYWVVDPDKQMIFVYFFESESCCPGIFALDADVPVHIYDGALVINLASVLEWIPEGQ